MRLFALKVTACTNETLKWPPGMYIMKCQTSGGGPGPTWMYGADSRPGEALFFHTRFFAEKEQAVFSERVVGVSTEIVEYLQVSPLLGAQELTDEELDDYSMPRATLVRRYKELRDHHVAETTKLSDGSADGADSKIP
jgi:hypothetical protein